MRLATAKQDKVMEIYDALHAELRVAADLNSRLAQTKERVANLRSQLARLNAECRAEMLCTEVA